MMPWMKVAWKVLGEETIRWDFAVFGLRDHVQGKCNLPI